MPAALLTTVVLSAGLLPAELRSGSVVTLAGTFSLQKGSKVSTAPATRPAGSGGQGASKAKQSGGKKSVSHGSGSHGQGKKKRVKNHLAGQSSPYLLQHLYNPVDWYPWGKEALDKAKKEKKPIFLSIGYAACHWCHVMEKESFENEKIAAFLNEHFVCIKVDREERPDIDAIYMAATMRLTGSGGWPMSVFLTPDRKPFYCGTYYPPEDRGRMPGFDRVIRGIHKVWTEKREDAVGQAKRIVETLEKDAETRAFGRLPSDSVLDLLVTYAERRFDEKEGGFGQMPFQPKFPHCTELETLLRYGKRKGNADALRMASFTLTKMARGGIYDQVGGGFHRYSVDREWLVPHFEKMLYDNSQLASLYVSAWKATGNPLFRRIATETFDYVLREMTSEEGGFYSTTDADSEGHEGKFFVWSKAELEAALGKDAAICMEFFGATGSGNFEGQNILTRKQSIVDFAAAKKLDAKALEATIEGARKTLYALREKRVHPLLDDKILSSWNGLMLQALSRGARWLGEERYLEAARKNAEFLITKMRQDDGKLFRTRREGKSRLDGFLEDYAFVTAGLLDLYEIDPQAKWLAAAEELYAHAEEHFIDKKTGGYFTTANYQSSLILRLSSAQESSLPSEIAMQGMNSARLGLLMGDPKRIERSEAVLRRHGGEVAHFPNGFGQMMLLADFLNAEPREIYVVGETTEPATQRFLEAARQSWPRYSVLAHISQATRKQLEKLLPAVKGKTRVDDKATTYVCRKGVCKSPLTDPSKLH